MSLLRLTSTAGSSLDLPLAVARSALLARREDGLFVQVADQEAAAVVRTLAFAGVEAVVAEADLAARRGAIPAVGLDLVPVGRPLLGIDLVHIRRVPLGEATAEVLRRRLAWLRPPSDEARARCRALLRGEDVLFAWDRRAWADRTALRDGRVRAHLRPIVFDRDALSGTLAGRTFASAGALGEWMFA